MYKNKINDSYTTYTLPEYIQECIQASKEIDDNTGTSSVITKPKQKPQQNIAIKKPITVFHKKFGKGSVISITNRGVMTVQFSDKPRKFEYPGALVKKLLTIAEDL